MDFLDILFYLGILPLLLTIVLEAISAYFCDIKRPEDQGKLLLINIATNTFINAMLIFSFIIFDGHGFDFLVISVLEVLVVFIEAKLFKRLLYTFNPLKLSVILNSISFVIGDLIYLFILILFL